jgi:TRAP transporter TAXI family solute receptor
MIDFRLSRRGLLSAAATLAIAKGHAQDRIRLVMATAGQGSAFLAFGKAIEPVVQHYAPIVLELRETRGSNENAALVSEGKVQTATLNMGPGFDAWNGQGPFAGRPLRGMRAVAPMYETPFHTVVLKESGIATLAHLTGKRVGVGPAGGPGEVFFRGLADVLGIKATLVTGTPADNAAKVLSKEIDAFWYGSGIPSPPFVEIANKAEAIVFGLTSEEAQAFRRLFPYFAPYEIPANTYRGQNQGLSSMAVWNFVVAHEGVPAEVIYALTKALLDHTDEVRATFATAAAMTAANAVANTFMPFHRGAARYYREQAVPLPSVLLDG